MVAYRIFTVALAMPEDFLISETWLETVTGITKKRIRPAISELQELGLWNRYSVYLDGLQIRNEHCVYATARDPRDFPVKKVIEKDTAEIFFKTKDGEYVSTIRKLTSREWIEYSYLRERREQCQ